MYLYGIEEQKDTIMISKVTLRRKEMKDGKASLYLDIYPPIISPKTGKPTRREYLKLHIFQNPKGTFEKEHNKENLRIAEAIRQQKQNFLNKPEIYSDYERDILRKKEKEEQCFLDYFRTLARKKGSNIWLATLKHLEAFATNGIKFKDLNERKLEAFKEYLLLATNNTDGVKTISQNSAALYFSKIKTALKEAYKDEILQTDLTIKISPIKTAETSREYLTLQEVNKLARTPIKHEIIRRAALFSALTGLRFSDIQKLTWSEIESTDDGHKLKFKQKKTGGVEELPINEQAYSFCGERGNPTDKVFKGLKQNNLLSERIRVWIATAGINKDITFHCFRHTYATMLLEKGNDIYTVSKMLGHRDLKTTQIYAKIVDESKRKAANSIVLDI
jgi:integrase